MLRFHCLIIGEASKAKKGSSLFSIFQRWSGGGGGEWSLENHAGALKYTRHQWEGFIENGTAIKKMEPSRLRESVLLE